MEKTGTVLPCPKCGSGFLAWGKPFRSATPKLVVLLGQHRRIVCCVMCGYYAPLKKRRAHESTSVVPVQWSVSVVQELLGLQ